MAKFCRSCGAPLSDTAKFCRSCGTPVEAPVRSTQQAHPVQSPLKMQRFCPYCGAPLSDTTKFCRGCGRAVTDGESVTPTRAKPTYTPPQAASPAPGVRQTQQGFRPAGPVQQPYGQQTPPAPGYGQGYAQPYPQQAAPPYVVQKKSIGPVIVNIVLGLLCIGLIVVGILTIPEKVRDARLPVQTFVSESEVLNADAELQAEWNQVLSGTYDPGPSQSELFPSDRTFGSWFYEDW